MDVIPKRLTLGLKTQVCDLSISRQQSGAMIPDLFFAAIEVLLVTLDVFILTLQDQQQNVVLFLR